MSRSTITAWVVASMLGVAAGSAVAAPAYSLSDVGTFDDPFFRSSEGSAINNSGQVTGSSTLSLDAKAFLYDGGLLKNLGTLGGAASFGAGINSSGWVTGAAQRSTGESRAFLYNGSQMQDLGTFGGNRAGFLSQGTGINDSGWVTGFSTVPFEPGAPALSHAFLYTGGPLQDLGTLGGGSSFGMAINASGRVVGSSSIAGNAATHAFLYAGGPLQDLGTLGGTNSFAQAVNAGGQIAGYSSITGDGASHAFLYSGGPLQDLGTLGGNDSFAFGVSATGQVVGRSQTVGNGALHAFLFDGGTMHDLNDLVDASGAGWTLVEARGINDLGQIVGTAKFGSGPNRAVVLSPVPEPATYALLLAGLAVVTGAARRRRGAVVHTPA